MKMDSTKNMTKAELEQRLKAKGDAISGRFESMEKKSPLSLPSLKSTLMAGSKSKVFLAVGAGLLVGAVFFRRGKSSKPIQYDDGLERLSSQLATRIADALSKGNDSQDAVRKALEEQPPLMRLSPETEGLLTSSLKQVMQTGVAMVGNQIAEYLRNRKKQDLSS